MSNSVDCMDWLHNLNDTFCHHHHHHHFVYRLLLIIVHTKARVRRYQQLNPSSISYPVHLPSLVRTLPCHPSHTSSMSSYSPLPHTTHHLQTSALRHPIIGPFTFHIPKSLNFPQAHLTLALDASYAPPPFPITSPK